MTTGDNSEKPKHNPQKLNWKVVATFNSYEDASKKKSSLKDEHTKIHRCGDRGSLFAVKVGSPLKK